MNVRRMVLVAGAVVLAIAAVMLGPWAFVPLVAGGLVALVWYVRQPSGETGTSAGMAHGPAVAGRLVAATEQSGSRPPQGGRGSVNFTRLGLAAAVFALAAFSFLYGQWVFRFSQIMWIEDQLGESSSQTFRTLTRTPPTMVPLLWFARTVLALAVVTVLASIVVVQRRKGMGDPTVGPGLAPDEGPKGAPSAI